MEEYKQALEVMKALFARDYQFAMATANDNTPSVRFVDTFYDNDAFFVVTHSTSQKVRELEDNSQVALCNRLYRFRGRGYNIGHPLLSENQVIREKLIKVFEPWYFAHNDEADKGMCYIKIELEEGFFYKDGTGYKVRFQEKTAQQFPFNFDIIPTS